MPTMILAAGLGTRFRPVSDWCPKALVPVGDRPVLAHVLGHLRAASGPIVINVHHGARVIEDWVAEHARDLRVSHESELLGTAGGVAHAREALGPGDVLVWNGDIVASFDVAGLVQAHAAQGSEATLAVTLGAVGTGNVGVDANGRVVRLRGETVRAGEVRGGEFAAVHVVGADLRGVLPRHGCLVGDVYLPTLRRGARLATFAVGAWSEVGSVRSYLEANVAWLAGRPSWVGAGARVAPGVALAGSVVGEGAEVVGKGSLERCVVWPGARAVAPLAGAVVGPVGIARGEPPVAIR